LVVAISQSGETADTLAALRLAKSRGIDTLAIVNVTGSSIAREAGHVLHTYAGPEIAVASTKAFSVQVAMLYLAAIETARTGGKLTTDAAKLMTANLVDTIGKIPEVISLSERLREIAGSFVGAHSLFYMGRGVDYSLAMEGSLKLKEISYIHSEAYAAGELKHGTISLITDGTPVIALATQSNLLSKTVSNIKEVRSRGGYVLLIAKEGFSIDDDLCDESVFLPQVAETFQPLLAVIVLQLIAYHVAVARGCDVDKPRNLAKSVTVE
jgi:glucosamine--fructose-6-phosphate aminotransferase (isomerizing)